MKNLKIILGIAVIAAVMVITACPNDDDPDKTWTVTFDANGGTAVASQTVPDGGTVSAPYSFNKRSTPTAEGLYPANKKATWKKGGSNFDFSSKITADTILKADWADQRDITLSGSATIVEKAVAYINTPANAMADKYILALNSDVSVSSSQTIDTPYADLEIIGVAAKNITFTGTGTLFTVGKNFSSNTAKREVTTIALTVGNNITLTGKTGNNNSLVWVRNGAVLTLDTGSKITGNTNTANTMAAGYGAAAIHVDNADFIMKGGTITLNTNSNSNTNYWGSAGAVYAEDDSHVSLLGGSISGNTNTGNATKDFYATWSTTLTVGGTANIGELALSTDDNDTKQAFISVASGFNGTVKINLRTNKSATNTSTYWTGKSILNGVTSTNLSKFTLGRFISGTTAADIPSTKTIDATGRLQ